MKNVLLTSLVLFVMASLTAGLALGQNPHFVKASATIDSDGSLVISWKEAGLGSTPVTYEAGAPLAQVIYACLNNGGKVPNDPKKQTAAGPVVVMAGPIPPSRNGSITGTITADPPPPASDPCPNGQKLTATYVIYEGIYLRDTTADPDITANGLPGSVSACLFSKLVGTSLCTL